MIKIKRPYLSSDKLRDALKSKINSLKKLSVDDFVNECKKQNRKMIQYIKTIQKEKDKKLIDRMIELDFALAWDLKWIDSISLVFSEQVSNKHLSKQVLHIVS